MRILSSAAVLAIAVAFAGPLAVAPFAASPAMAQTGATAPRSIAVTGEGRVAVAPDMAMVSIGVTTEADTAREALDANNSQLAAALAAIKAAGIEDRDIQTAGLSLGPRYDYNRSGSDGAPAVTGFVAANTLTVRVRALDALGGLLDAVVSDGANTLGGISFGLQDPEPVLDAARKAAVTDARRKAELYATVAGVALGAVQTIAEQSGYMPPAPMALAEASYTKGGSVPVAGGEVAVVATVSIVWAMAD